MDKSCAWHQATVGNLVQIQKGKKGTKRTKKGTKKDEKGDGATVSEVKHF